ncbi:MAG: hypothetical protein AB8B71_11630 [Paracoccaceae bacterium]
MFRTVVSAGLLSVSLCLPAALGAAIHTPKITLNELSGPHPVSLPPETNVPFTIRATIDGAALILGLPNVAQPMPNAAQPALDKQICVSIYERVHTDNSVLLSLIKQGLILDFCDENQG